MASAWDPQSISYAWTVLQEPKTVTMLITWMLIIKYTLFSSSTGPTSVIQENLNIHENKTTNSSNKCMHYQLLHDLTELLSNHDITISLSWRMMEVEGLVYFLTERSIHRKHFQEIQQFVRDKILWMQVLVSLISNCPLEMTCALSVIILYYQPLSPRAQIACGERNLIH